MIELKVNITIGWERLNKSACDTGKGDHAKETETRKKRNESQIIQIMKKIWKAIARKSMKYWSLKRENKNKMQADKKGMTQWKIYRDR